ncbi:MAG TPA: glycosyltransferase [Casimicrobiaceae bacterium]|nr:glycosyltransferase [Casimicrobiaceae bacterium]
MTPPPRVSAIVAVYNGAEHVASAIDSLFHQTLSSFEILVVDDGSMDETEDILARYRDPRIRVLVNDRNRGIARSRNRALREARGHYVACMDADDVSSPLRFERQVRFLDEHPDIAMVGTAAGMISAKGDPGNSIEVPTDPDEIARHILEVNCFVHSSVMIRRSAILAIGGYDESLPCTIDYDLALRVCERYKAANLAERLVDYRIHAGQLSLARLEEQRALARECQRRSIARRARKASLPRDVARAWAGERGLASNRSTAADDYIAWSRKFASVGDTRTALALASHAVRARPLSPRAWSFVAGAASARVLGCDRVRGIRWLIAKATRPAAR